jgi:predicted RND superfamily exporter protein
MKTLSIFIIILLMVQTCFASTRPIQIEDQNDSLSLHQEQLNLEVSEVLNETTIEKKEERFFRKLKREYRNLANQAKRLLNKTDQEILYKLRTSNLNLKKYYYFTSLGVTQFNGHRDIDEVRINLHKIATGEAYEELENEVKRKITSYGGIENYLIALKAYTNCMIYRGLKLAGAVSLAILAIGSVIISSAAGLSLVGIAGYLAFTGAIIGTVAVGINYAISSCNREYFDFMNH